MQLNKGNMNVDDWLDTNIKLTFGDDPKGIES